MALAFGTSILDGRRTKICTVTCLEDDPAANLAVVYASNGMTNFQGGDGPDAYGYTILAGPDEEIAFAITAAPYTGFTIRKLTAGAHAVAMTLLVWLRRYRGIAS